MIRIYLIAYNLLLFFGWSIFLIYQYFVGFEMDQFSLILLNICQVSALLEVVHAAKKWVKSPVFTTFIQIASRIFVLYWINVIPEELQIRIFRISGVNLIAFAWGLTEMIRYSYYFFGLINVQFKILTVLRYTFFIVLYPMGVTGEWMIILSRMKMDDFQITPLNAGLGIILAAYFYFFPKLYLYMFRQRLKKL